MKGKEEGVYFDERQTFETSHSLSPWFFWYFFQAIRHVQTMYEEAYNDYLKDREKGNGTLVTFHSTVSNFTSSLISHLLKMMHEPDSF